MTIGCYGTLWGVYGVLWDAMGSLWDAKRCYSVTMGCYGMLWGIYGALWGAMGSHFPHQHAIPIPDPKSNTVCGVKVGTRS